MSFCNANIIWLCKLLQSDSIFNILNLIATDLLLIYSSTHLIHFIDCRVFLLLKVVLCHQTGPLAKRLECLPVARETRIQSQVESYQRFKKWYLMSPCLTLSIIKYGTRVKWSNPEKGVSRFPTPRCSSYWKGSLRFTLDYGRQLYLCHQVKSFQRFKFSFCVCFTFCCFLS